jgi:hypothetical protein
MKSIKEKTFEELTTQDCKELTVEFAPGCFDTFDGTQEELDSLIAEIQLAIKDGSILEKSRPLDIEKMIEEDPELAHHIAATLSAIDGDAPKRTLQ